MDDDGSPSSWPPEIDNTKEIGTFRWWFVGLKPAHEELNLTPKE